MGKFQRRLNIWVESDSETENQANRRSRDKRQCMVLVVLCKQRNVTANKTGLITILHGSTTDAVMKKLSGEATLFIMS